MPDRNLIAESLEKVTEELALQIGGAGGVTPDWSEFDWKIAQAAVALHGIGPTLSLSLRWHSPAFWTKFLAEQNDHNRVRYRRIQAVTEILLNEFKEAGMRALMLKGAALYRAGCYASGERPMADLDVLVSPEHRKDCAAILARIGYRLDLSIERHDVYVNVKSELIHSLGEHADNPIKIEVHSSISEKLLSQSWDITDVIFSGADPNAAENYPESWALMAHLLLHAAGGMKTKSLRILHLCDIARLARLLTVDDWERVVSIRAGGRLPWWAFPPLLLTSRYFPLAIPPRILAGFESACPAFLRWVARRSRIADVSFSRLTLPIYAGVEWASSASDLSRYLLRRVIPDKEMRRLRRYEASSPVWGNNDWLRLPRWRRAIRLLTSPPPRKGSMIAVDDVLSE